MTDTLFDTWIDRYDSWFDTPVGRYVREYEAALLLDFLKPRANDTILDVGCGTGLFTQDVIASGAKVTGVDLSGPMLKRAVERNCDGQFIGLCADMCTLPFQDNSFDKVFSMTAIEFVGDASKAIAELLRVTRSNGTIVVTTLNSLSPWAEKRKLKAKKGHSLFNKIYFRSPEEICSLVPYSCTVQTAIHFQKTDPVEKIPEIEAKGSREHLDTGAFLAIQWKLGGVIKE